MNQSGTHEDKEGEHHPSRHPSLPLEECHHPLSSSPNSLLSPSQLQPHGQRYPAPSVPDPLSQGQPTRHRRRSSRGLNHSLPHVPPHLPTPIPTTGAHIPCSRDPPSSPPTSCALRTRPPQRQRTKSDIDKFLLLFATDAPADMLPLPSSPLSLARGRLAVSMATTNPTWDPHRGPSLRRDDGTPALVGKRPHTGTATRPVAARERRCDQRGSLPPLVRRR